MKIVTAQVPWETAIKGFRAYLMLERSLSSNSVEAYLNDIGKLATFIQDQKSGVRPEEVNFDQLLEFVNWINALGLGARTQARIISGIRAFFRYLLMEDRISDDPTELIEGPRLSRDLPDILDIAEIERIFSAVDLSHPQGTRNRAMLETLYACGLRVSELINLKLSNLYLDIGAVKVIGKNNKERIVPIGGEAIKHITYYLDHNRKRMENVQSGHEDTLFLNRRGKGLSRVMVFMLIKQFCQAAGIDKKVSPHSFRHAFATHLVEGGADLRAVQEMLGHASITTTEIYTHLSTEYLRETILLYHPQNKRTAISD